MLDHVSQLISSHLSVMIIQFTKLLLCHSIFSKKFSIRRRIPTRSFHNIREYHLSSLESDMVWHCHLHNNEEQDVGATHSDYFPIFFVHLHMNCQRYTQHLALSYIDITFSCHLFLLLFLFLYFYKILITVYY
jgi:hypothetical protein